LSIRRQCELLSIGRSNLYCKAKTPDLEDVSLLNLIRDAWMKYPFYGYRRITKELRVSGMKVNHKRVQRAMVLAGIKAIYPGPNTSRRNHQHAVYPYLLRDKVITRSSPAWLVG